MIWINLCSLLKKLRDFKSVSCNLPSIVFFFFLATIVVIKSQLKIFDGFIQLSKIVKLFIWEKFILIKIILIERLTPVPVERDIEKHVLFGEFDILGKIKLFFMTFLFSKLESINLRSVLGTRSYMHTALDVQET